MIKFVTDWSAASLKELNNHELTVTHCGQLWIVFFATPEQVAKLSFADKVREDSL